MLSGSEIKRITKCPTKGFTIVFYIEIGFRLPYLFVILLFHLMK